METIKGIMNYLMEHYSLYMVIVLVISMMAIYFLLNLIKIPIKKQTNKIQNKRVRAFANKSIIVISFGLATGIWALLNYVLPTYFDFELIKILLTGCLPVVMYAVTDGVIDSKKANKIINTVKEIIDDGEVDKSEIKEIGKEMINITDGEMADDEAEKTTEASSENELNKLLK